MLIGKQSIRGKKNAWVENNMKMYEIKGKSWKKMISLEVLYTYKKYQIAVKPVFFQSEKKV